MRETIEADRLWPMRDKALVRLVEKSTLEHREFTVVRSMYDPTDDWEVGVVEALGEGDWEPVGVGDHVLVRALSGGKAGSDISRMLGEHRASHIIVRVDEVVARVVL